MGTRKPSEAASRTAADGPAGEADARAAQRERRRRRADEAGLQSLVRTLATRDSDERSR
jgi:hypothetical protein